MSAKVYETITNIARIATIGLCAIAGILIVVTTIAMTKSSATEDADLYTAKINSTLGQKTAFINTVATGGVAGVKSSDYNWYDYVDAMVDQFSDVSAVYVCIPEDGVIYSDGIMTYMSGGWLPPDNFVVTDRAWYKGTSADNVYISEPYVDEQSGGLCITVSKAIATGGVAGMDMYMDDLVSLVEQSYSGNDYVFLVSKEGTILTHPNNKISLTADSSVLLQNSKYAKLKPGKVSPIFENGLSFAVIEETDTGIKVVSVKNGNSIIFVLLATIIVGVLASFGISTLVKKLIGNKINPLFAPLEDMSKEVSYISKGVLTHKFNASSNPQMDSEEVNGLADALNFTMSNLQSYIGEISNVVNKLSNKQFDIEVTSEFEGEFASIKDGLNKIVENMNMILSDIKGKASTVHDYAMNLSKTSESVAETATNQSQAVMAATEEMKEFDARMDNIGQYAESIRLNSDATNNQLIAGSNEMKALVSAMTEIANCFERISAFSDEIAGIAGQTNLLALNASIEAARAGEAGRGFAVVAEEIGNLSNNSSNASKEIGEVIAESLKVIEKGKNLVAAAEKTFVDATKTANENSQYVSDIADYVSKQQASSKEVSQRLADISTMVESNAASAQENSAISTQLGQCAEELISTLSEFNLK